MTVASPLTIEEYYQHPTEPECEFFGGEVIQKASGTLNHGELQGYLCYLLYRFQLAGLCKTATELCLRLDRDTLLIPDVCVTQPHLRSLKELTEPPLLCIEILSPSDRFLPTVQKCARYIAWGVPFVWIFDPEAKRAWSLDRETTREVFAGDTIEAGPFFLPFDDVFANPV